MSVTAAPTSRASRGLELLLWLIAGACLATLLAAVAIAVKSQHDANQIAALVRTGGVAPGNLTGSSKSDGRVVNPGTTLVPSPGDVIGRLDIPALQLSVPITAGVEMVSLLHGVGHVDGTATPGGLGTMALAGHRDTYLRGMEKLAVGMDLRIVDSSGVYHYTADRWEIVMPEDVSVLSIRSRPELVLITCYPFHYVGAAPERFVVHAHLVSASPDSTGQSPSAK